jgi:hypothetical protein
MRTKKFVDCATTSLLVGLAVNFAVAAGDQHFVNLENEPPKSKYSPGLAAKIVNLKIESDENGIKIDAEGTDGDGNPTHAQYDAKFDGKDYGYRQSGSRSTTRRLHRDRGCAREAGSPSGRDWIAPHRGWATLESTSTTATAGPRW